MIYAATWQSKKDSPALFMVGILLIYAAVAVMMATE